MNTKKLEEIFSSIGDKLLSLKKELFSDEETYVMYGRDGTIISHKLRKSDDLYEYFKFPSEKDAKDFNKVYMMYRRMCMSGACPFENLTKRYHELYDKATEHWIKEENKK